mmetsp:Transcript_37007/g.54440  ORF Transcript_37007/g.54440 Transcript_37007/m.54440 type:complete len:157 (+) Transcript_37007:257-727(+)
MVLGEGTAIARDELTEIEAFMAVYGNGKGTGVNMNLPRNVHGFGGRWYMMKSKKKSVLIHELERSIILFGPGKTPDELRRIYRDHHEDDGEEEEEWNEECEEEEEGEEEGESKEAEEEDEYNWNESENDDDIFSVGSNNGSEQLNDNEIPDAESVN